LNYLTGKPFKAPPKDLGETVQKILPSADAGSYENRVTELSGYFYQDIDIENPK
jgi:hypothetical protein